MAYCVYKHTFPNGKVYIGITSQKPEDRWDDGCGYLGQSRMRKAILKYGWCNVEHEILYNNLTKNEALIIEADLIRQYKSNMKKFGYNISSGTTFGKGNKSNTGINVTYEPVRCIDTNKIYNTAKEAYNETGITVENIRRVCNGNGDTAGGFRWEYINEDLKNKANLIRYEREQREGRKRQEKKSVRCIETGIEYNSIADATRETGIGAGSISMVCRGCQELAGGYHWEFVDDKLREYTERYVTEKEKNKRNRASKPVKCVETGIVYESMVFAQRETGINKSEISKCCNKELDIAGGYHWEYAIKKDIDTHCRPVICLETKEVYGSIVSAAKDSGNNKLNILRCCTGERNCSHGYHWKFVDEDTH